MVARILGLLVLACSWTGISSQWFSRNPAPAPLNLLYHSAVLSNISGSESIYVFGGQNLTEVVNSAFGQNQLYRYDIWANTWNRLAVTGSIPRLCGVADMLVNNRYWVFFGGSCSNFFFVSFNMYQLDLTTLVFTDVSASLSGTLPSTRTSFSRKCFIDTNSIVSPLQFV